MNCIYLSHNVHILYKKFIFFICTEMLFIIYEERVTFISVVTFFISISPNLKLYYSEIKLILTMKSIKKCRQVFLAINEIKIESLKSS